jgi:hypothetical protein
VAGAVRLPVWNVLPLSHCVSLEAAIPLPANIRSRWTPRERFDQRGTGDGRALRTRALESLFIWRHGYLPAAIDRTSSGS